MKPHVHPIDASVRKAVIEKDREAEHLLSQDAFYRALIATKAFRRLKDIRFLGAIDYFEGMANSESNWTTSRYSHCIQVAYLALEYARRLNFDTHSTRRAVAVALLHDLGHGPLSHSTEHYFKHHFELDHHKMTANLLKTQESDGDEVQEILNDFHLSPSVVAAEITSPSDRISVALLALPVNGDTVDGISRSMAFFEPTIRSPHINEWVRYISTPSPCLHNYGDEFWRIKALAYKKYIYSSRSVTMDAMITEALATSNKAVKSYHFYMTDSEFCDYFASELFAVTQRWLEDQEHLTETLKSSLPSLYSKAQRHFSIDTRVSIRKSTDQARRYLQSKATC